MIIVRDTTSMRSNSINSMEDVPLQELGDNNVTNKMELILEDNSHVKDNKICLLKDNKNQYLVTLSSRSSGIIIDQNKVPIGLISKSGLNGRILGEYTIKLYLEEKKFTVKLSKTNKLSKNPNEWLIQVSKEQSKKISFLRHRKLVFCKDKEMDNWHLYCTGMDLNILLLSVSRNQIEFHTLLPSHFKLLLAFSITFILNR
ncbi:hypothetical protein K502DRAFT_365429 [Neoconidiobolus thromboides FSU 785]|nr:hypothetical protein K502DRAFT_365429 [Neoconidiobolus thromboides FSU 785]